jgi:hypothetical protein
VAVLHIFKSCHKIWSTLDPELPDCWADTFAVHCLSSYKSVWTQNIKCNACMSAFDNSSTFICPNPPCSVQSPSASHKLWVALLHISGERLLLTQTTAVQLYTHPFLNEGGKWMVLACEMHVSISTCICSSDGRIHTHMCHMLSNMHSISCISTFLAPKIFAMIKGVAFLVNLKQYRAACNCSWIVTSLNLLLINAFFSLWIREMLHVKFRTTYMPVARNSPAYKASFHGTFLPCFFP